MNILARQSNLSLSGSADVGFNYPISANEIISKAPSAPNFRSQSHFLFVPLIALLLLNVYRPLKHIKRYLIVKISIVQELILLETFFKSLIELVL